MRGVDPTPGRRPCHWRRPPVTYEIRAEAHGDELAIHAVTRAAFLDAPHADHTEQAIVDALREDGALAISLVAQHGVRVVGHVAVSRVTLADDQVAGWYGLGPISVLPEYQRQGIGTSLMRSALSELRERGAAGCVLVGDPAYYGRFGFGPAAPLRGSFVRGFLRLGLAFSRRGARSTDRRRDSASGA